MEIANIIIPPRIRKHLGDISLLAASIEAIGLLHPVVVDPQGRLIAGERRIAAFEHLGRADIPVTVVKDFTEAWQALQAEGDENTCRLDFSPSEAVASKRAMEPIVKAEAKERKVEAGKIHGRGKPKIGGAKTAQPNPKSRDIVAAQTGRGRTTVSQAEKVVEAAEADPSLLPIVEKMDKTGNVSAAVKEVKKAQKDKAKNATPKNLPAITERYAVYHSGLAEVGEKVKAGTVDWIITDPPYPKDFLPLYDDLGVFASRVLKPGGSLICMVGQSYLPDILNSLQHHLTYWWMLAYLTPGGQAVQQHQRKVNAFWKPLLWLVRGEHKGDWIGDVCRSKVNDNDKEHHHWGQSESGMADIIERFTYPGENICDPFCGGGTTGVVAVRMKRLFVGIDSDKEAVQTTLERLAEIEDD